jgi:hypothetical protein
MNAFDELKQATRQLECLAHLYIMVAYNGFDSDEAGNDIPGVVTIPEGGGGRGLAVKDAEVHRQLQKLKVDAERKSLEVRALTGRYYRRLWKISEGR